MSSYQVIRATSDAMRTLLWDDIRVDPVTLAIVPGISSIVLTNPTETRTEQANRLSLWLYHVTEDPYVKNQPMIRMESADPSDPLATLRFPPLALRLYYLFTPFARTGEEDHLLLGKAMQTVYDNAIVVLTDQSINVTEELRIVLYRNSLEEQTRIWDALNEPYRLSISYQVTVNRVESGRLPGGARVIERMATAPVAV